MPGAPRWPFPGEGPLAPAPGYAAVRDADLTVVELPDGTPASLVTRHALVVRLLGDPRLSARPRAPGFPAPSAEGMAMKLTQRAMVRLDAPEHTRLRAGVLPQVRRATSLGFAERVTGIAERHVGAAVRAGGEEVAGGMAARIPVAVMADLLGIPLADAEELAAPSFAAAFDGPSRPPIDEYFDRMLRDGRTTGLAAHIADALDASGDGASAASTVAHVFTSGLATVRGTIAASLLALARHPDQYALLRVAGEPGLRTAAEELLRFTCVPRLSVLRAALEDVPVGDAVVPAGTGVIAAIAAANRDPREFDGPDELRLDRTPNRHLTFAPGTHGCLGGGVATLELRAVLAALVRGARAIETEEPVFHDGTTLTIDRLVVAFEPA